MRKQVGGTKSWVFPEGFRGGGKWGGPAKMRPAILMRCRVDMDWMAGEGAIMPPSISPWTGPGGVVVAPVGTPDSGSVLRHTTALRGERQVKVLPRGRKRRARQHGTPGKGRPSQEMAKKTCSARNVCVPGQTSVAAQVKLVEVQLTSVGVQLMFVAGQVPEMCRCDPKQKQKNSA